MINTVPLCSLQQTIFCEGDQYFSALLTDLDQATQTIELETYIFNSDALAEKIIDVLVKAAQRGVKIRVLVDGAGSPLWGNQLTKKLEKAGVLTRIFHPFPWRLWHLSRSYVRVPALLKIIYLLLKINLRNHRKVCLIDHKVAYVGSFNISKVHLSAQQGGDSWRDIGVKLTGVDLSALIIAFNMAWDHSPMTVAQQEAFRQLRHDSIILLNTSRYLRRFLYKSLLHRINDCGQRIWMMNAYFVPDNFLLKRIKQAAARGVDVRILLPRKSDVFFMPWASNMFYQSLLKAGVRIFEYLPSMLHTKVLLLDDWVILGSSNLNHRSLLHDLEVDVNIVIPAAKEMIEQQFLQALTIAEEVQLSNWYRRPWYQRWLGKLLLYVKYWI